MNRPDPRTSVRSKLFAAAAAAWAAAIPAMAPAQSEGGLYVAGDGSSFQQTAGQALEENPGGKRFFVLAIPPETDAPMVGAAGPVAAARDRVLASNGLLYACQRDIANGKVSAATLVPGVVAVRGWPPAGSKALPEGARYFRGENPARLPVSESALRRLRSTCAD